MSRFVVLSIFLLVGFSQAQATVLGSIAPLDYDCSGTIYNDEMADYCANEVHSIENFNLWQIGTRHVYHSFEVISQNLSAEIENDYDMILLVNAAPLKAGSPGDFIPGQSMLVVKKAPGANKIFNRDRNGVITGLASGTKQLSQIIGTNHRNKVAKASSKKHGMPYTKNGLELVPVSTGSRSHLLSFSGIFQVNWGRSAERPRRGWGNPMSNPLYLGYFYTNKSGARERVSYAATHGTPKKNWHKLGKKQDSHGCTRVHPAVMEDIRAHFEAMPEKEVFEFNWDYELPTQDLENPYVLRKPLLIMIFEGYESVGL